MVKKSKFLLLPNWDIVDALVFNSISNKLDLQNKDKKEFQGTAFNEDQVALVIWSLTKGSQATSSQPNDSRLMGNIIVIRVVDTTHVQAAHMNVGKSHFVPATAEKEQKAMFELQSKYERILEAYNKEVQKRIELENEVMGRSSKPRTTYPCPPVEPFKSTPLIQIPNTPQRLEYYTTEEFEEEKSKLWELHVELNVQYKIN